MRLLVGLSGIPASGKSSLASLIVQKINITLQEGSGSQTAPSSCAILIGLDGWHLTRAQLDAFPEPKLAHDRRGAHWTFDGVAYVEFIRSVRQDLATASFTITAPSFDHALKDPTPDAVFVQPHHRIVIIEGLYTFLSIEPWSLGGSLLDERWFLEVGVEEAQRRLVKRHIATGVTKNIEEAVRRAEENDIPSCVMYSCILLFSR